MTAGDVDVQIATTMTAAAIKTAVEDAVTAAPVSGGITALQLNDGAVVIIAVEGA